MEKIQKLLTNNNFKYDKSNDIWINQSWTLAFSREFLEHHYAELNIKRLIDDLNERFSEEQNTKYDTKISIYNDFNLNKPYSSVTGSFLGFINIQKNRTNQHLTVIKMKELTLIHRPNLN